MPLWEGEYSEESKRMAKFLQDRRRPEGISNDEFRQLQKDSSKYFTRDGHLFRRPNAVRPSRRVVDHKAVKLRILKELHDDSGHKGRETTVQRISDRYFWEGMWKDVQRFIKTCAECQFREGKRLEEEMYPTYVDRRWYQVNVDCTPMPNSGGKTYLVEARSNFSGWVEARGISSCDSHHVSKFLWEEVICRHGMFKKLVVDGGPENKKLVTELAQRYAIKKVVTSAYHPQANGIVEVGHRGIADALSKMSTRPNGRDWMNHLHAVLWSDRTTVKSSTGCTPYELEFVDRPILPIELEISTWNVLQWDQVRDTAELVAMRARALERRNEDLEEAAAHLRRMRELGKQYFDRRHNLRREPLEPGMLVLSHDTAGSINMSAEHKLAFRWFGPFRIMEADSDKGTFVLSELDGARLRGTFAGNRLKRFYPRAADSLEDIGNADISSPPLENGLGTQDAGVIEEEEEDGDMYGPGYFSQQHQGEVEVSGEGGSRESEQDRPMIRRSERLQARARLPTPAPADSEPEFWVEVPLMTGIRDQEQPGLHVVGQSDEDWRTWEES